ncbi:DnaA ATPase domain-containing protein [uncultured Ruminococcus sp.]|uniref:DnaA ATPase domain-containing protein n=1 Tax=uncultured Ruminococcus sp. TaxID=165186 RepID=UPI002611E205|nr:DnaA/Hda family protein [uncultured Ruminococcus sp.]
MANIDEAEIRKAVAVLEDGYETHKACNCLKIRQCLQNIQKSGLSDALERMTFDSYQCSEPWQEQAKQTAQEYTRALGSPWLYLSGQSGAGKTHLCTAVCGVLLKRVVQVQYTMWRDICREMQSFQKREDCFRKLMGWEALYIDDFLKTSNPRKELDIAFEIINGRYASGKRTILSSEILLQELLRLDAALAGRIRERCGNGTFVVQISKNTGRNHRLTAK